MIDPLSEIAVRMLRHARTDKLTVRYWAGWRLQLTFGPYEEAFSPEHMAQARELAPELVDAAAAVPRDVSAAIQANTWHLSASWRGGHPAESAQALLGDLLLALGVPTDKRCGFHFLGPNVRHWVWEDEGKVAAETGRIH